MWLGIAIGVSLVFGVVYLLWSTDDSCSSYKNNSRRVNVACILVLILGIVWSNALPAQYQRDADIEAKRLEEKTYYEKCIVETSHEVNGKVKSYSKVDTCIK